MLRATLLSNDELVVLHRLVHDEMKVKGFDLVDPKFENASDEDKVLMQMWILLDDEVDDDESRPDSLNLEHLKDPA